MQSDTYDVNEAEAPQLAWKTVAEGIRRLRKMIEGQARQPQEILFLNHKEMLWV